ncbi:lactosylceramide alpha-2,3-sialyltransferase-like isoform X2 [Seriola lalandi dorsalis]|uniref:lactosylceramide alpha-2,3-sialyltransferase-like isoform X2 n=1 Tax=Seriola lalandi dorsalis TaxID=1841481 RepID=UPI000C6FA1BB|nr:lactosylceramide alpha-2,3-sialyltransferase-like isoform X2 [Seriola lalandi dorsalis]
MVTLNHLSVEDQDNGSSLLPEAAEAATPTPVSHRQRLVTRTDSREFFLSRSENLAFSLVLLIGCYSAILIPAYFPLDRVATLSNDYQHPKDLVLLNRSASLLSDPCQPRWCLNHLKPLSCSAGLQDIPVFVQQDRPVSWDLAPPLGLQGSEEHLALALASLPEPGLPPSLRREGSCRRCMVVGSGGVLHGSHLGAHIDQYDIIIRLNNAPVPGFEKDAGSRTTIRLIYPEGAPHSANEYKKTTMVALVVFKSLDLDWLTSVITKQPLSFWSKMWFWRKVVDDIPLRPENFRILHPEIIHKTGQVLKKYALKQGNVVHDVSAEKLFLRDLVASGAVTDLTGAL